LAALMAPVKIVLSASSIATVLMLSTERVATGAAPCAEPEERLNEEVEGGVRQIPVLSEWGAVAVLVNVDRLPQAASQNDVRSKSVLLTVLNTCMSSSPA
jgi:hypothetical protein